MIDKRHHHCGVFCNRSERTSVYSNVTYSISSARAGSSALAPTALPRNCRLAWNFLSRSNRCPGRDDGDVHPLALALKDADATLVNLMIFGSVSAHPAADEAMRRVFGRIDWPVTWVEGAAYDDHPIAGMQAFAFSAGRVTPITLNGHVAGSVFEEDGIRHCLLGGLGPESAFRLAPRSIPANAGESGNSIGTSRFFTGRCCADLVPPR